MRESADLKPWAKVVAIVLVVALLLTYICAKIHFFTRYSKVDTGEYLTEHWPYWATMLVLGAAMSLVCLLGQKRD